eukprot:m51a1_g7764 putative thymidine cytosolic (443) ;mRNA; f:129480-132040
MGSKGQGQGSIEVIFGPMFSGKTTELLRRIKRHTYAMKKCLVIKYINDTRYSATQCSTHDSVQCEAVSAAKLSDVPDATDYDVIGIDEGQFFPDVVEYSEAQANAGKLVIVSALDGTYQRRPFGRVLELVPLAESVVKLSAVCLVCRAEAAYTLRLGTETELEVIGGADKYIPVCRACHLRRANVGKPLTDFYPATKTPSPAKPATPARQQQQQQRAQGSPSSPVRQTKLFADKPYINDTRYSATQCSTHDSVQCEAVSAAKLSDVPDASDYDVIGIDEGQFFPDVVEYSEAQANAGKLVIVSALDGTYQRRPFGRVLELVPLAESVVKLSAVCLVCRAEAAYTLRLGTETELEVIGGADKYIPVCRACHLRRANVGKPLTDFYPATKTPSPAKPATPARQQQQQQRAQGSPSSPVRQTKLFADKPSPRKPAGSSSGTPANN